MLSEWAFRLYYCTAYSESGLKESHDTIVLPTVNLVLKSHMILLYFADPNDTYLTNYAAAPVSHSFHFF